MTPGRLEGRVSVVTGAASGIGRAIALALAGEGSRVVGLDLQSSGATWPHPVVACDVTDPASVTDVVARILRDESRIDVLVNAAGIWRPGTILDPDGIETWDAVVGVNLRGTFLASRAVVPSMIDRGGGSIVNIGSISGIIGNRGSAAYSASKGAVISLTRAMAVDHAASGIRVNCLCPGFIRTPMLDATEVGLPPEDIQARSSARVASIPLGREGRPTDLAPLAVHLASDDSAWTTGACFTVDGGFLAGR